MVDAALTDLSTHQVVGTQQFVLFWGASPFVYAGFTGPVRLSDRYLVKISVEPTAALRGLLDSPAERERLSRLALARVAERFAWSAVAKTTVAEYRAAIAARAGVGGGAAQC